MMFFMAWMAVMIFIPFFAPSLSVLAFGEAMCGVSWGVFQVRSTQLLCSFDILHMFIHCICGHVLTTWSIDSYHYLRVWSRPDGSETICNRLCLHVLGCWNLTVIWCCSCRSGHSRWPWLETTICYSMGLADPSIGCSLSCTWVSLECGSKRETGRRSKESNAAPWRLSSERKRSWSSSCIHPTYHSAWDGRKWRCKLLWVLSRSQLAPDWNREITQPVIGLLSTFANRIHCTELCRLGSANSLR